MIVTLSTGAEVDAVRRELARLGLWVASVERSGRGDVHLVVAKSSAAVDRSIVEGLRGVASVSAPSPIHPLVDAQGPTVDVAGVLVGAGQTALIAGPCSVESEEQIARIAAAIAPFGVRFLRGGAPSSRGRAPTRSRATAETPSPGCVGRPTRTACAWSPRCSARQTWAR
jgi:hypothetical protein